MHGSATDPRARADAFITRVVASKSSAVARRREDDALMRERLPPCRSTAEMETQRENADLLAEIGAFVSTLRRIRRGGASEDGSRCAGRA
jgi:hypothetical protein